MASHKGRYLCVVLRAPAVRLIMWKFQACGPLPLRHSEAEHRLALRGFGNVHVIHSAASNLGNSLCQLLVRYGFRPIPFIGLPGVDASLKRFGSHDGYATDVQLADLRVARGRVK